MTGAFDSFMAAMVVQVTVLAALVAVADRLLPRRAWPQLRMGLWLLVFVKLVLPPGLVSVFGTGFAPGRATAGPVPAGDGGAPLWPLLVWAAGAAIVAAVGAVRRRRVSRRLRPMPADAAPAWLREPLLAAARRIGLRRIPRVAVVESARCPAIFGALRPVLVVPAGPFRLLTPEEREHVLLHELAHVRRRDPLVEVAIRAIALVYWFHPVVWLAGRRVRDLREACCDATVAGVLREGTAGYRRTLLRAAGRALLAPAPAGALPFLAGGGIVGRLRALEGTPWRRPVLRRLAIAAILLVVGVAGLPMAVESRGAVPRTEESVTDAPPFGCIPTRLWLISRIAESSR
jgi:beta-lactamase regulating signal transducer with metallopeptidase domain